MFEPNVRFASDNIAGICPEAWDAMQEANGTFVPPYGDDRHSMEASNLFRELFETDCDVYHCSGFPGCVCCIRSRPAACSLKYPMATTKA